ncbi:MAG: hypothetical protein RLZZ70_528 [Candidatus Parcubacteria bacterium]|jgi:hypothetical protein
MIFSLVSDYLRWHYSTALVQYIRLIRNWWWFVGEFFSITLLLETLFTPLTLKAQKPGKSSRVAAMLVALISRLGGACIRIGTIIAGLSLMTLGVIVSIIGYIVWLIAPAIPLLFLIIGSVLFSTSLLGV